MPLSDGSLDVTELRRLAALLRLRASVAPPTLGGRVQAAQDRIDAGALMRWADAGCTVMVLPVGGEDVRPVCWPRLGDGADGVNRH